MYTLQDLQEHLIKKFHQDYSLIFHLYLFLQGIFLDTDYLEKKNAKWLLGAGFTAGMAFANKYSGILALPILMGITIFEKRQTVALKNVVLLSIGYLITAYFFSSYFLRPFLIENTETEHFLSTANILSSICIVIVSVLFIGLFFFKKRLETIFPVLKSSFLIGLTFIIGFAIGSPDSLKDLKFINGILKISAHINAGHWFSNEMKGTDWLFMIFSNNMLNPVLALFTISGLLFILYDAIIKKQKLTFAALVTIWVFIFMAYLMGRVRAQFDHYLLPVVPFVIIIASIGISFVIKGIKPQGRTLNPNYTPLNPLSRGENKENPEAEPRGILRINWLQKNTKYAALINGLGMLIIGYFLIPSLMEIIKLRTYLAERDTTSGNVIIGNYLKENYPSSSIILADYYSYVPSNFKRHYPKWGLDSIIENTVKPDIIITTRIAKRYEDIAKADFYKDGKEVYLNRNKFYRQLSEGQLNYKKMKQSDDVTLYEKVVY